MTRLKLPTMSAVEIERFARSARPLAAHNERLALVHLISSQSRGTALLEIDRRIQKIESGLTVVTSEIRSRLGLLAGNAANTLRRIPKSKARTRVAIALLLAYGDLDPNWSSKHPAEFQALACLTSANGDKGAKA